MGIAVWWPGHAQSVGSCPQRIQQFRIDVSMCDYGWMLTTLQEVKPGPMLQIVRGFSSTSILQILYLSILVCQNFTQTANWSYLGDERERQVRE